MLSITARRAMDSSQVRAEERPSNRCRLPRARRNVSWVRSSALWGSAPRKVTYRRTSRCRARTKRSTASGSPLRAASAQAVIDASLDASFASSRGADRTGVSTWCLSFSGIQGSGVRVGARGDASGTAEPVKGERSGARVRATDARGGEPTARRPPVRPREAGCRQATAIPKGGPREVIAWARRSRRGLRCERPLRARTRGRCGGAGSRRIRRSGATSQPAKARRMRNAARSPWASHTPHSNAARRWAASMPVEDMPPMP